MFIIGLTGPTGSGKSTVAGALAAHGYFVADGDAVAREITKKGSATLEALADTFGRDIIRNDGELDRALLAQRAFSSPENTVKLNGITHPAITEKIFAMTENAERNGYKVAVIDAAALFESGISGRCDLIAVVSAPMEIRLKRIICRDKISQEQAMLRIGAQKNDAYYEQHADIIIKNGLNDNLEKELAALYERVECR